MYIYIYTHTYIYVYIHTHIYMLCMCIYIILADHNYIYPSTFYISYGCDFVCDSFSHDKVAFKCKVDIGITSK